MIITQHIKDGYIIWNDRSMTFARFTTQDVGVPPRYLRCEDFWCKPKVTF